MSDSPIFRPDDEDAFFVCPCFKQWPERANRRDDALAEMIYRNSKRFIQPICLNRAILIMVKATALMIRHAPPTVRQKLEGQVHDMLDQEMALNPSKD